MAEDEEPTLGKDASLDPDCEEDEDEPLVAWRVTVERITEYRVWAHPDADEDEVIDLINDDEAEIVDEATMNMRAEPED